MPHAVSRRPIARRIISLGLFIGLTSLLALPTGLLSLLQPTAHAATTFTVNSTGDGADSNVGDGLCNDGAGNCTLRAAIQQTNATPGTETITFYVPGTFNLPGAQHDYDPDLH